MLAAVSNLDLSFGAGLRLREPWRSDNLVMLLSEDMLSYLQCNSMLP